MFTQLPIQEPAAQPERRRFRRHAVRCHCWIEGDDLTVFGPTIDIGIGGLFLRTAIPLPEGREVDVVLQVNGKARALDARGVITRLVPAHVSGPSLPVSLPPCGAYGVGIEFLRIRKGERSLLSWLKHEAAQLGWATSLTLQHGVARAR